MKRLALLAFALLVCSGATLPQPTGQYVADFAGVLTPSQVQTLGARLKSFETTSAVKTQVVAVLPASLEGLTVEDYANQMFREWKIGQKDVNNGILIVVAPKERKLRLEIGYGLEGAIPDSRAKHIIELMAAQTRGGKNDWAGAIAVAATELGPLLSVEERMLAPTGSTEISGYVVLLVILGVVGVGGLLLTWFNAAHRSPVYPYTPAPMPHTVGMPSNRRRSRARSDDSGLGGFVAGTALGSSTGSTSSSGSSWSSGSSGGSDSGGGFSGGGGDSGGGGASGDA